VTSKQNGGLHEAEPRRDGLAPTRAHNTLRHHLCKFFIFLFFGFTLMYESLFMLYCLTINVCTVQWKALMMCTGTQRACVSPSKVFIIYYSIENGVWLCWFGLYSGLEPLVLLLALSPAAGFKSFFSSAGFTADLWLRHHRWVAIVRSADRPY
jgi:hypothetical protein